MRGPLQPKPVPRASRRSSVRRVTPAGAQGVLAAPAQRGSRAEDQIRYQSSSLPDIGDVLTLPVPIGTRGIEPWQIEVR